MSNIPCRKCPECGFYHDVSVISCSECKKDLTNVPALIVDIDDIPGEVFGKIDENIDVFVQKCSACGALNFTADKNKPIRVCYNCHKTRVSSIIPVEYLSETEVKDDADTSNAIPESERRERDNQVQNGESQAKILLDNDNDNDDDDDDDYVQWQGILENIRKAVGTRSTAETMNADESDSDKKMGVIEADYDDDEDFADWSGILGKTSTPQKEKPSQRNRNITLTAIRYGQLSFTIEAKMGVPYMLGRSANQSDFLSSDGRVGNEHCHIVFKDGFWYVKDNHSANGTAVNSKDIGLGGEHILNNGDELKLGHHPDSMAFRITI